MRVLSTEEWAHAARSGPPGAQPEAAAALARGFDEARAFAVEAGGWIVPLVRRRSRVGEVAESMPWGVSGGPLPVAGAPAPLDPRALRGELGVAVLRLAIHPARAAGWEGRRHTTHVLDLGGEGTEEYRSRARRHVRAAQKRGVEAGKAEPAEVARLLRETAQAAGRHAYPDAAVEAAAAAGAGVIARVGGEPVSAALFLTGPTEWFYWLGGSTPAGLEARASYAAMDLAVRSAAEAGARRFDFGASEGLPGVASFKEGFGAHEETYPLVQSRAPVAAAAEGLGDRLRR